jgi:hypothetical protein
MIKEVEVIKEKKGKATVIMIDGMRYVLDMKTKDNKK